MNVDVKTPSCYKKAEAELNGIVRGAIARYQNAREAIDAAHEEVSKLMSGGGDLASEAIDLVQFIACKHVLQQQLSKGRNRKAG